MKINKKKMRKKKREKSIECTFMFNSSIPNFSALSTLN